MTSVGLYMFFISLSIFVVHCKTTFIREAEFLQLVQYQDTIVTTGLLWSVEVPSVYSCAIACYNDRHCIAFFHSDNNCSGYDQSSPAQDNVTTNLGEQFFCEKSSCTHDKLSTIEDVTTSIQITTLESESWCTGDRFVKDTVNNICYKASDTKKSRTDAAFDCVSAGGRLAILDTQEKLDLVSTIPDFICSPGKLEPVINKCYTQSLTPMTWTDTNNTACIGGMLATFPDNSTYYHVIQGLGILNSTELLWLGIHDTIVEMTYQTADDKDLPWNNMVAAIGYFNRDCVVISQPDGYKWKEEPCSLLYRGICEINLETVETADFWIGMSDTSVEGDWKWDNGANVDMLNWHSLQPDGGANENFGVLSYQTVGNKFLDMNSSQLKYYICEKNI